MSTHAGKELIFMGRILGLHDGWDANPEWLTFYGFWPHPDATFLPRLPNGDLTIDITKGTLEIWAEGDEAPLFKGDVVPLLSCFPRKEQS